MRLVLVLALLLAVSPARAATAPSVVATPSKTEVTVGETFVVEVRATGPEGATFTFPAEAKQEKFELSTAPPDSAPWPPGTHRYRAKVFALGDASIPAIPVRYRLADGTEGEVETAEVPLTVASLLPKEEDERKLADIKGPVDLGVSPAFWVALVAALALIAALVWWLRTRRRRVAPVAAAPVPVLAPNEEALRALDALVASGLLARDEYRRFYIELTVIAKRYLERRLDAPILEMTTAETIAHLRATPHAVNLAPTLRDLTGAADQIKFAKGSVLQDTAERHLAATRALIDELEKSLAPAAPAGGQAA